MADDTDDWLFDDDDEWQAAWDEANRQAAEVLREACPAELERPAPKTELAPAASRLRAGLADGRWPFDYFANAMGEAWTLLERDVDLWVAALSSTISPPGDPKIDIEQQSAVAALMHADWLGMVVGLVRRGAGAEFSAEAAQRDIDTLPELEGEVEDPEGHLSVLSMAVTTLTPLWQALEVLDDDERLTELGRWGLPHALYVTWMDPYAEDAPDVQPPEPLAEAEVEKALAVLARQSMSLGQLRLELGHEGVFASTEQLRTSLIWRPDIYEFDDGMVANLPALADGLVLTHRITEDELRLGTLKGDLDLDVPALLALDGHPLAGGGEVKTVFRSDGASMPDEASSALVGPEGWLAAFAPGDLLGMRYADRQLALERVDLPSAEGTRDDVEAVIDAAREAAELDATHGDGDYPGTSGAEIVLRCRSLNREVLCRPLPPLSEILADVEDLDIEQGFVAQAGTARADEPSWLREAERSTYRTWHRVLETHDRGKGLPDSAELASLAGSFTGSLLALAALDMANAPEREEVAVAMAGAVEGRTAAVPAYLRACAAEGRGDGAAWLAHLEAAVAADDTCREALGDLGDLRAVAGDAREAERLYRLAGLDNTSPEIETLTRFLQPPETVGRNKPCPCGSGKKYKVCHGRTDAHPLPLRARWLWQKLDTFCQRGVNRPVLLHWAEQLTGEARDSRDTVFRAMGDPMVVDLAAFGDELMERFLGTLGPLLPADERELAETWRDSPLRLMEVLEVRPMRGVRVRDLVTGEELEVVDRRMTTDVKVKDVALGRPLDDGGGDLRLQVPPMRIPRMMRSRLVAALKEGPAEEVVADFLAGADEPPEARTTEGEELVMCTARYESTSPDDAWRILASEMTPDGDDVLLDEVEVPGQGVVVRGSVRREGSRLVVETNAIERLRRIQQRVLTADPKARLIDEATRPMADLVEELRDQGENGPGSPATGGLGEDALPADVLRQIVRQHEDNWLDDHVPALGGHTPREAAQDPVLREELMALLDDFEWQDRQHPTPFAMDVARLRQELGLES